MNALQPFHLAFPVRDIQESREFYGGLLGCPEGRSDETWVDFNLFGHQIVAHLALDDSRGNVHHNAVDSHDVPVPHFGVVLEWSDWETLAERLKQHEVQFVLEPYIRFKEQPGEQATMFFLEGILTPA